MIHRLSLLLAALLLLVSCARTPSGPEIPDNSTALRAAAVTSRAVVPTAATKIGGH